MIVECLACPVRGQQCGDCAVTALLLPMPADLGSPTRLLSRDLLLDAAERSVVSMFVGAGLVNTGAVAGLRARRESEQPWGTVRDAG